MLTIDDIRDSNSASGFKHVTVDNGGPNGTHKPFRAHGGGRSTPTGGNKFRGPRRATAVEAAADYCVFVNSGQGTIPLALKSAGHKRPKQPKRRLPQEVRDALGVIKDWNAQVAGKQGYVYLIVEDLPGGVLRLGKIGYSTNPAKRVAELQTGNPRKLRLLYMMPGTREDEQRLHQKYVKDNSLREWFYITKELLLEFPAECAVKAAA